MSICEKHIWPVFKVLLSAGSPLQKLVDRGGGTHLFLNDQALKILINDRKIDAFNLISKYRSYVDLGNLWADQGWKCFAHYYQPQSGRGFIPLISAATEGLNHFNRSIISWKNQNPERSIFFLGATAHIVQDMCVPHHAMGIAFNGHRKFELWASDNKYYFKIEKGGIYGAFRGIKDLIDNNATIAQEFYIDTAKYNNKYINAGKEMLCLAQRTTAFLFDYFARIISSFKI